MTGRPLKLGLLWRRCGWIILFWLVAPARAGPPVPQQVLITEFLYDAGAGMAGAEWIEVANMGPGQVDLSLYKLGDAETRGANEGMYAFPEGANIRPGQVVVVAQRANAFQAVYGWYPDYEVMDSVADIADMRPYAAWAGGQLALANEGDEVVLLDGQNRLVDVAVYGAGRLVEGFVAPTIARVLPGQSLERRPAHCDSDTAADWRVKLSPSPGQLTLEGSCPRLLPSGAFLRIGDIQGGSAESPYVNQRVSFRGVVTGLMEDQNVRGARFYTAFVQDPLGTEDGRQLTSDGIAVFLGPYIPEVVLGDLVRVRGQVVEYFGLTEIDFRGLEVTIESRDNPLPEPVDLTTLQPGLDELADLEWLEGVRVTLPLGVAAGPTHSACGLALVPPAALELMGEPVFDSQGLLPLSILFKSDVDCSAWFQANSGDRITDVTGPLTYHFGQYKIVDQETAAGRLERRTVTAPEPLPMLDDGSWRLASLNTADAFDMLDDPLVNDTVLDAFTFSAKLTKLSYAISETLGCPTLVAVQEVENSAVLQTLADRLHEPCGFGYEAYAPDGPDARGIDVGLLKDPGWGEAVVVSQHQTCTALDTGIQDPLFPCPSGESPLFSRPPLEVQISFGERRLTVIVTHFKSRLEGQEETAPRRLEQAMFVAGLVEQRLLSDPQSAVIVAGDFNDPPDSPTGRALTAGRRLVSALDMVDQRGRYTYNFGGVSELLDWIATTSSLDHALMGSGIAHINADYAAALAHDLSPDALAFRSSDHDIPFADFVWPERNEAPTPAPTPVPEPASDLEPTRLAPTLEPRPLDAVLTELSPEGHSPEAEPEIAPAVQASAGLLAQSDRERSPLLWAVVTGAGLLLASLSTAFFLRRHKRRGPGGGPG
jgi:endonuclease/exonuclease/phosphatase family metal-dependent hydrolase